MNVSDNWNPSLVSDTCPRESLPRVNSDRTQQPMFKHSISSSCLSKMHPIRLVWGERRGQISEWWNHSEGIQLPHARYCYINIWFKRMWDRSSIIQSSFNIRDVECARTVVLVYTLEWLRCNVLLPLSHFLCYTMTAWLMRTEMIHVFCHPDS